MKLYIRCYGSCDMIVDMMCYGVVWWGVDGWLLVLVVVVGWVAYFYCSPAPMIGCIAGLF